MSSTSQALWTQRYGLTRLGKLRIGPNNNGWDHDELQFYTDSSANSAVSNGSLKIIAKREPFGGSNFTSARLLTRNKVDFKYGRVEVRAKLPVGSGTWSALWMLPTDSVYGAWPNGGEIDIVEHVGNFPSTVTASAHTLLNNHRANASQLMARTCTSAADWRIYSVEWTSSSIRTFVDNEQYLEYKRDAGATWKSWPFDEEMFLVLNLAVGGTWGSAAGIDEAAFDGVGQILEVDYVRVYSEEFMPVQ